MRVIFLLVIVCLFLALFCRKLGNFALERQSRGEIPESASLRLQNVRKITSFKPSFCPSVFALQNTEQRLGSVDGGRE